MNIKAVVFDLYDTLIQIENKRKVYRNILGFMNGKKARIVFLHLLFMQNCSLQSLLEIISPGLPGEIKEKFVEELNTELGSITLFDDTISVLQKIKRRGIKIGVISNLTTPYKEPFFLLGLDELVDEIIFSCDVGLVKPDRRIYKTMCRRLLIEPSDILMVGDSYRCDYDGPIKTGMQARLLDRQERTKIEERISSLTEVLNLL